MNETDNRSDRLQVKSRPRPGTSPSSAGVSVIAPPPCSQKKNGNLSQTTAAPDLISFNNPTVSTNLNQFCNQPIN